MKKALVKRGSYLFLSYLVAIAVVLALDYYRYQKIEVAIERANAPLISSGMTKGQVDAISQLVREVTAETRLQISLLTMLLLIGVVPLTFAHVRGGRREEIVADER